MPILTEGGTQIPYSIRFSRRARKLSIRVTPSKVEAVAPEGFPERRLVEFVHRKRAWILRKVEEHADLGHGKRFTWPERFVTGARIPFRGRNMQLRVSDADVPEVQVRYRNALLVLKPGTASEVDVKQALEHWMHARLLDDITELVARHAPRLGVKPGRIRVSRPNTRWGSCGRRNDILINGLLVMAPRSVAEYVVVHELCHIKQRNHSDKFWLLVAEVLPEYQFSRNWLREHGRFMSM
jgi:predicted metal-dependent hydrolase